MNRSSQQSAIILRIAPMGESHAFVDILTREAGLFRAVAYGLRSRRGSLKGKIEPFARGEVYLYTDPRRELVKITDFDVRRYADVIRTDLAAYYHVNLWAEVLWRTHASGDVGPEVFELLEGSLDGIEIDPPPLKPDFLLLLSILFLWRYLAILGVRPDLDTCAASERRFAAEEIRFYGRRDSTVVGAEWADPGMVEVPSGTARLLDAAEGMPLVRAARLRVTAPTLAATRAFVFAAVQDAVEVPLNTLRVGAGWV